MVSRLKRKRRVVHRIRMVFTISKLRNWIKKDFAEQQYQLIVRFDKEFPDAFMHYLMYGSTEKIDKIFEVT